MTIRTEAGRALGAVAALLVATAIWLPCVSFAFRPVLEGYRQRDAIAPQARALAQRHLALWEDEAAREDEVGRMRESNAEWDFMGRTFLVLALANLALREPADEARYLATVDRIVGETLALERERGMYFFLMDYARRAPFLGVPPRSLFLDGEIALMLAARQLVARVPAYDAVLGERLEGVHRAMSEGPVSCAESYPDECWTFCNAVGIAALAMGEALEPRGRGAFIERWLATAKARLTDARTGLLVSSFTYNGRPIDGPEGSTIWLAAHCLALVDPAFARDQYGRAARELGCRLLGFGYAREWPESWRGAMDVDSGPIVPVLGASAGSSGMAVLGAAAFGDDEYLTALLGSLDFAAFPVTEDGRRRYAASNQVGDAVLLYALVQGPLWERARASRVR